MRRTAPISLPHRSRKRPRAVTICHSIPSPAVPLKRMCRARTPTLPLDVWHNVATHLPPAALANLSLTSAELSPIATATLQRKLWHSVFPAAPFDAPQAHALVRILSLLSAAPSLRPKRVAAQVALLCRFGGKCSDLVLPISACFSKSNATRFLRVDACHLSKLPLAKVTTRSSTSHFPSPNLPHVHSFFDSDRKGPLYPLASIVRAALATHTDLNNLIPHLKKALVEDERRFQRACIAHDFVQKLAADNRLVLERLDYCLDACAQVREFRRGTWDKKFEEYAPLVARLVALHSALEPCYRFLLKTDGNARLKAKRLITKLMRVRAFSVAAFARTLEANLWWARSDENLRKMRKEMRLLHVSRSRASTVCRTSR